MIKSRNRFWGINLVSIVVTGILGFVSAHYIWTPVFIEYRKKELEEASKKEQ